MTFVLVAYAVFVAFVCGLWFGLTIEHRWWSARIKQHLRECQDEENDARFLRSLMSWPRAVGRCAQDGA